MVNVLLSLALLVGATGAAADEDGYRRARLRMVDGQIAGRGVVAPGVLEAMRTVPRHLFVEAARRRAAYRDTPLPIGHGQTISQPFIVARMTELLEIASGDRLFELGTGSGYQAAVASRLAAEVFSMEIHPELAARAATTLGELGYANVAVRQGDGYYGWVEHAPFDAIIVTAAATHIPPPLIAQLKAGGRMVIPVGPAFSTQRLMLVEKGEDGTVTTRALFPVRFVPVTGGHERR